mmetsp:Transcript_26412/g.37184  ORF Transcript_26412/g.37184 Transcript_26412/m.37184 type:complete len:280 (-) Transcript_26412:43-882(-)
MNVVDRANEVVASLLLCNTTMPEIAPLNDLANTLQSYVPIAVDGRTTEWPMMRLHDALLTSLAYLVFVIAGRYLSFLPKMELKFIRMIHNFFLTIINLYMVVEIFRQAYNTTLTGPITRGEAGVGLARILWVFYMSKIIEFFDTVIMILRKSYNQISLLHVYHHVSVFLIWWFNMTYYPGGEAWPSAWLNSFVHVWMYSYYFISTFGINVFWKRYLTQLQISQLSFFVIQGIWLFIKGDPEFRFIGIMNGIYALTILVLFVQFYVQTYSKPRDTKKKIQ